MKNVTKMSDHRPRLYTLFGKLTEDSEDTVLVPNVCKVEAKAAFRAERDRMRSHGFSAREWKGDCDNLPGCTIINLLTGKPEATYWLRETA